MPHEQWLGYRGGYRVHRDIHFLSFFHFGFSSSWCLKCKTSICCHFLFYLCLRRRKGERANALNLRVGRTLRREILKKPVNKVFSRIKPLSFQTLAQFPLKTWSFMKGSLNERPKQSYRAMVPSMCCHVFAKCP